VIRRGMRTGRTKQPTTRGGGRRRTERTTGRGRRTAGLTTWGGGRRTEQTIRRSKEEDGRTTEREEEDRWNERLGEKEEDQANVRGKKRRTDEGPGGGNV